MDIRGILLETLREGDDFKVKKDTVSNRILEIMQHGADLDLPHLHVKQICSCYEKAHGHKHAKYRHDCVSTTLYELAKNKRLLKVGKALFCLPR